MTAAQCSTSNYWQSSRVGRRQDGARRTAHGGGGPGGRLNFSRGKEGAGAGQAFGFDGFVVSLTQRRRNENEIQRRRSKCDILIRRPIEGEFTNPNQRQKDSARAHRLHRA